LNDGTCEIGYAFREVIDLSAIAHDIIPAEHPGEVFRGDARGGRTSGSR